MRGLLLLCALVACVLATPPSWERVEDPASNKWVPFRLALKQRNLDVLEATLLDVSNPHSVNYGKWWTNEQILDLVAPPAEHSQLVADFLESKGARNIQNLRDMIKCEMKVHQIEELFQTVMGTFEDVYGVKQIIRTTEIITMPSEIAPYVTFTAGLEEFPVIGHKDGHVQRAQANVTASPGIVTIGKLQDIYGVPATFAVSNASSLCLAEFVDYPAFGPSDLKLFAQQMGIPAINLVKVLGLDNNTNPGLESQLDIQYGGGLAINTPIWFWTLSAWMYELATDLVNMKEFPLVVSMSWGTPEPLQCMSPPNATDPCSIQAVTYTERVNNEFMKAGLMGITLVAASGDDGAYGQPSCSYNPDNVNLTTPFANSFPATSPWVLSVGATMLVPDSDEVADPQKPPICNQVQCNTATTEAVCSWGGGALITSGGGFSNYLATPSYQSSYVKAYLNSGVQLPPPATYNSSTRGYPDVAALGHNYYIADQGGWIQVDGTSASTPVTAAIVSLLNSWRLSNGKSSLGFVNQVIYEAFAADSTTFNDITSGSNNCGEYCCGKLGWEATKGWDPVTGLGTPNFPALLKYVQSLN